MSVHLELTALHRSLGNLSWSDVKLMAIHLDGCMDLALLTDIEREHPVEERVLYAMKAWLDKDCEASWAKVVSALRAISKNVLAVKMENEYCTAKKPMTTPHAYSGLCGSAVVSPHPPTELNSVAHSLVHEEPQPGLGLASLCQSQPENVLTSEATASSRALALPDFDCTSAVSQDSSVGDRNSCVAEEAAQLQEQFVIVLTHTKICFMKKEATSKEFLFEFQITLTTLPLSKRYEHMHFLKQEKDRIKKANIEEIFDILEPYLNYVDYAFLEFIIKEFGTSKLQKEMKEYIAELEKFEKKTTVKDSAILDKRNVPAYFNKLTVTQAKDPAQCSLYEVRKFKNDVVNRSTLNVYAVYLKGVSCSSVNIIFALPPEAYAELLEVFDEQFMVTHKIVAMGLSCSTLHEDTASATPMKPKSETDKSLRLGKDVLWERVRPKRHTCRSILTIQQRIGEGGEGNDSIQQATPVASEVLPVTQTRLRRGRESLRQLVSLRQEMGRLRLETESLRLQMLSLRLERELVVLERELVGLRPKMESLRLEMRLKMEDFGHKKESLTQKMRLKMEGFRWEKTQKMESLTQKMEGFGQEMTQKMESFGLV